MIAKDLKSIIKSSLAGAKIGAHQIFGAPFLIFIREKTNL